MQPIHLSYTPERADFAVLFARERTPVLLRVVFFGGVVAMSSGLGWLDAHSPLFAALDAWSPPWGEAIVLVLMVTVMYGVLAVLRRLSCELRAARAAAAAGPVDFAADGDGVRVTTGGRADLYPWRDVGGLRRARGHVLISLAGRRLALPRRAFAGEAAMGAFAAAAAARMAAEADHDDAALAAAPTAEAAP